MKNSEKNFHQCKLYYSSDIVLSTMDYFYIFLCISLCIMCYAKIYAAGFSVLKHYLRVILQNTDWLNRLISPLELANRIYHFF